MYRAGVQDAPQGNTDKLICSPAEPVKANNSTVACFPSISCGASCAPARYTERWQICNACFANIQPLLLVKYKLISCRSTCNIMNLWNFMEVNQFLISINFQVFFHTRDTYTSHLLWETVGIPFRRTRRGSTQGWAWAHPPTSRWPSRRARPASARCRPACVCS